MADKVSHGIDVADFRFRKAKEALAPVIYYARSQAFNLCSPHWDGASQELRDEYLNFSEAILKLPNVRQPIQREAEPVPAAKPMDFRAMFLRITRAYAYGLRPTHDPVIGAIAPREEDLP